MDEHQLDNYREMLEEAVDQDLANLEQGIHEINMDMKTKVEEVLELAEKLKVR